MFTNVSTEHAKSIFRINVKGTDVVKLHSHSVSQVTLKVLTEIHSCTLKYGAALFCITPQSKN